MKKKLTVLALMIFVSVLLMFYPSSQVAPANSQEKDPGQSIRDLNARVGSLEAKIADLQKQIKNFKSESARVLTIPDTKSFRNDQMPPGSRLHEIGGIKYWTVPLGSGK